MQVGLVTEFLVALAVDNAASGFDALPAQGGYFGNKGIFQAGQGGDGEYGLCDGSGGFLAKIGLVCWPYDFLVPEEIQEDKEKGSHLLLSY